MALRHSLLGHLCCYALPAFVAGWHALPASIREGLKQPVVLSGWQVALVMGKVFILPEGGPRAQVVTADVKPSDCSSIVHIIDQVGQVGAACRLRLLCRCADDLVWVGPQQASSCLVLQHAATRHRLP